MDIYSFRFAWGRNLKPLFSVLNHCLMFWLFCQLDITFDSALSWKDTWFLCLLFWTIPVMSWLFCLSVINSFTFRFCFGRGRNLLPMFIVLNRSLILWSFCLFDIYSYTFWFCFTFEKSLFPVCFILNHPLMSWICFLFLI